MTEIPIGRRNFVKNTAPILYAVGLPPDLSKDQPKRESKSTEHSIEPEIQIGNLLLTPILTEHDNKAWKDHGQEVLDAVQKFDLVIPEYFPPEYNGYFGYNALTRASNEYFKDKNVLFDHLAEYSLTNSKTVIVLDPAYSEASVLLRMKNNLPISIGVGTAAVGAIKALNLEESDPSGFKGTVNKISRRTFILAAVAATTNALIMPLKWPQEAELRQVCVAEGLIQLGSMLPKDTRAAIIYPKGHWKEDAWLFQGSTKGIYRYLTDETVRKETLESLAWIKETPVFTSLFQTRKFIPESGHWTRGSGFEIT